MVISKRNSIPFHFRRPQFRARQRGVTVFVVVLALAMLTGLGLFAARSATLATTVSGYERQMTQTHYITEYALLATTAELSSSRLNSYITQLDVPDPTGCRAVPSTIEGNTTASCYKFSYSNFDKCTSSPDRCPLPNPSKLTVDLSTGTPGSLGQGNLKANFIVEVTDYKQGRNASGYQANGTAYSCTFRDGTLTVYADVGPKPTDPDVLENRSASIASFEMARGHISLGPICVRRTP